MPPSTVPTCVIESDRIAARHAFGKILGDRPTDCETPHRLVACAIAILAPIAGAVR